MVGAEDDRYLPGVGADFAGEGSELRDYYVAVDLYVDNPVAVRIADVEGYDERDRVAVVVDAILDAYGSRFAAVVVRDARYRV